ncbi:MAG TPA: hypothetical protein VII95_02705 [Terriglobales bacterium]
MAGTTPTKAREDFSIECGAITISKRGEQLLSGFASLISAAMPAIRPILDTDDAEPDSDVKQDAKTAANIAIQFCISCAFECANTHYGTDQASLLVDALFYRFFDKVPNDELFQRYLELPLLPNQLKDTDRAKGPSRIFQFSLDISGGPSLCATVLLPNVAVQLILDGKAVLEARDPKQTANTLAKSFAARVNKRHENAVKVFPAGGTK